MDTMPEDDDREELRRLVGLAVIGTIRTIAEALRSEFDDGIDAHPGGVRTEAGTINRAFRTATLAVLKEFGSVEDDDAQAVQTGVLRQVALGRLHDLGVAGTAAEVLIDSEPKLGDPWLAYLALAPATVIDDLMGHTPGGSGGLAQAH